MSTPSVKYAHPKYSTDDAVAFDGKTSFGIRPEKFRVLTYATFWGFILCVRTITRTIVHNRLLKGAPPDTPIERLGCGPFDRNGGRFNLTYGQGFNYRNQESHLVEAFGFGNICTNWDYTPAREIGAVIFPFFEYSLMAYIFVDLITIYLSYKRGELPKWFYNIARIVLVLTMFLCVNFRQIFVNLAYERTTWHTAGFLCLQFGLIFVATINVAYILLTGQCYPSYGYLDTPAKTKTWAYIYITGNVLITIPKLYATWYIVFGHSPDETFLAPAFYDYPMPFGLPVLGRVIDLIWMLFNAILPAPIAWIRMKHEMPIDVEIYLPPPDYEDEGEETAPLTGGN